MCGDHKHIWPVSLAMRCQLYRPHFGSMNRHVVFIILLFIFKVEVSVFSSVFRKRKCSTNWRLQKFKCIDIALFVWQHLDDDYFLTSGDKIRYFFEKTAFNEDGLYCFSYCSIAEMGSELRFLIGIMAQSTVVTYHKYLHYNLMFRWCWCFTSVGLRSW